MASLTDQDIRDLLEQMHGQQMAQNIALRALLRDQPSTKQTLSGFLARVEDGEGLPDDLSEIARESLISTLGALVK